MKSPNYTCLIIPSPDINCNLQIAFIQSEFQNQKQIKLPYKTFSGLYINLTGSTTMTGVSEHRNLQAGQYQLLYTNETLTDLTLAPGFHSLAFINLPYRYMELFKETFPIGVEQYRHILHHPPPYTSTINQIPWDMETTVKLLFNLASKKESLECYGIYQLIVSVTFHYLAARAPSKRPHRCLKSEAARNLLIQEYNNHWTLDLLAERLNVHKRILSIRFKNSFAQSPMQYLRLYRLTLAHQLLARNESNINQVARKIGYKQTKVFKRAFLKHFGYSIETVQHRFPNC